jgi:hypothetical protein
MSNRGLSRQTTSAGKPAVAHEFGDETVVTRDRARTGALIGADYLAHVLGIEPSRQRAAAA